ncbi:MAG: preprotein translocase subunit SecA [Alphaproteobacteria bacterium]
MVGNIFAKIFGTASDREIKRMQPLIKEINALEPQMKAMTDEQLAAQTDVFRKQLAGGAKLEDLMAPAYATLREASFRVLNMRDFDVQLMGGIALHQGKIAEMKTGEGKTLVATLAVYLNALEGKGAHVVTVNDYLAKRDAEQMGKLYGFMGLTTGAIVHGLDDTERRAAYACDITYGTNNEFGFDYLRDNMKFAAADRVQRGHNFAVIDEVDSILIDEARTPLIISGPSDEPTEAYRKIDSIIPLLERGEELNADDPDLKTTTGDFTVDEKQKTVTLTEQGTAKVEHLLGLNASTANYIDVSNQVNRALKAHVLFQKDKDYIVKDGEIIIVDEFTGRLMPGRRWSDGLHQAVEAKENVKINPENQTLATVTFQNYFRMYKKLAGMTGTAMTEAAEFGSIYKLDVVQVPTNAPMIREDFNDAVYRSEQGKFHAAARDIKALQEKGQPVLVGTVSVEKSEYLSALLTQMGVKHEVLNAKQNDREAAIVAQAGRKGAVTVSTNMAGRGTDIKLGGDADFLTREALKAEGWDLDEVSKEDFELAKAPIKAQVKAESAEVKALGGLHIIGTERHESRRIDNQLRGRSGRQGDPGSSRFYISLQDHLSRVFGGEKLRNFMTMLGMDDETPIESKMVSNGIAKAQKGVENQNFMTRENLLKYDDVMNKQREVIYGIRNSLLDGTGEKERMEDMVDSVVTDLFEKYVGKDGVNPFANWEGLETEIIQVFDQRIDIEKLREMEVMDAAKIVYGQLLKAYDEKEKTYGADSMRGFEQTMMLSIIDNHWKDHLYNMDGLKRGIGWRSYAQLDPLLEYKKEAFNSFQAMMDHANVETLRFLFSTTSCKQEMTPQQMANLGVEFSSAATPVPGITAGPAVEEPKPVPAAVTPPPPPAPKPPSAAPGP